MNNDIFDKAFDTLLDEAAAMVDKTLGEQLEADSCDEIEFSDGHIRKMEKLFAKERRRENIKKLSHISKIAACVVCAVILASGAAVFSVEAWRSNFINFWFDPDGLNTDIKFGYGKGTSYTDDYVVLKYLPMGFEKTEEDTTRFSHTLIFERGDEFLFFDVNDINVDTNIDTEGGTIERIAINGYEAIYATGRTGNHVIWCDEINALSISGNLPRNELIKIAENTINMHKLVND